MKSIFFLINVVGQTVSFVLVRKTDNCGKLNRCDN